MHHSHKADDMEDQGHQAIGFSQLQHRQSSSGAYANITTRQRFLSQTWGHVDEVHQIGLPAIFKGVHRRMALSDKGI